MTGSEKRNLRRPGINFGHLERMTDDTGLLEHCLGSVPRRKEGYTTDDNARALWVCVARLESAPALPPEDGETERWLRLADIYLEFLLWAQKEDGTFHNNFYYDRTPEPEQPSDDCFGRVMWACACAYAGLKDPDRRLAAAEMLRQGFPGYRKLISPRGWAYTLAACHLLLHAAEADNPVPATELRSGAEWLEQQLVESFRTHSSEQWRWFESVMTYGNGVLAWGLLIANRGKKRSDSLHIAKRSLDFLIEQMTAPQGWIRPVGNKGWCTEHHRSLWEQQPLDVMKLALACQEAYRLFRDARYWRVIEKCRGWFYGENDGRQALADAERGSCCDGLTPEGVNENRGAESTIAFLLTEIIYWNVKTEVDREWHLR